MFCVFSQGPWVSLQSAIVVLPNHFFVSDHMSYFKIMYCLLPINLYIAGTVNSEIFARVLFSRKNKPS